MHLKVLLISKARQIAFFTACCSTVLLVAADDIAANEKRKKMQLKVNPSIK